MYETETVPFYQCNVSDDTPTGNRGNMRKLSKYGIQEKGRLNLQSFKNILIQKQAGYKMLSFYEKDDIIVFNPYMNGQKLRALQRKRKHGCAGIWNFPTAFRQMTHSGS